MSACTPIGHTAQCHPDVPPGGTETGQTLGKRWEVSGQKKYPLRGQYYDVIVLPGEFDTPIFLQSVKAEKREDRKARAQARAQARVAVSLSLLLVFFFFRDTVSCRSGVFNTFCALSRSNYCPLQPAPSGKSNPGTRPNPVISSTVNFNYRIPITAFFIRFPLSGPEIFQPLFTCLFT